MRKAYRILVLFLVLLLGCGSAMNAQSSIFQRWKARRIEKKMAGPDRRVRDKQKVEEPRSVTRAKKEQEKRQAELRVDYKKAVKANRQRNFNIQSDNVKERMKQNEKEIRKREKERRKAIRKAGRKARKKYK